MLLDEDGKKTREQLLSELLGYRQYCAHLQSEANRSSIYREEAEAWGTAVDHLFSLNQVAILLVDNDRVLKASSAAEKILFSGGQKPAFSAILGAEAPLKWAERTQKQVNLTVPGSENKVRAEIFRISRDGGKLLVFLHG